MEIKKISNKIGVEEQFDVELQGCLDDCKEYYGDTASTYLWLKRNGVDVSGNLSASEILEVVEQYGDYCFMSKTAKTSIWR